MRDAAKRTLAGKPRVSLVAARIDLLRRAAALLLLLAAAACTGCSSIALPASPPGPPAARISVTGLRARVTVRRDARGIPYIEAGNEHDLYFAQGFVTARDRLWQMDLLRRTARGELAEILGRDVLEQDAQMRTFGFGTLADGLVERVTPRTREALAAYAEGVNACIASDGGSELPAEFSILGYRPGPWRPGDSLVIGKLFALDLDNTWSEDLMRASFADLPEERRAALFQEESPLDVVLVGTGGRRQEDVQPPPADGVPRGAFSRALEIQATLRGALRRVGLFAEDAAASNNWVVSGRRSATGKPLLANDPHLAPSAPSIWYLTHLSAPGIRVAGVTTPGVPGILIGHNDRVAWGVTNLMADVQDLYAESFDAGGRYDAPGGPREALKRTERIVVRGDGPAGSTETAVREVTLTRHGPVVSEAAGVRFALRWTALDRNASELAAFLDIDRASDWKEFVAALSGFTGPPLNFVYADVSGHIGYYAAGQIPVRSSGDGTVPYSGADDRGEWTGWVPFDELPHLLDPAPGVIVTANNRVVGSAYPRLITRAWDVPYRARRIADLLAEKPRLSADDFQAIQADTYSIPDVLFARAVAEYARTQDPKRSAWAAMLKAFDGWDGRARGDSSVLPLVVAMRRVFTRKILAAALGSERAKAYRWANADTLIDEIVANKPPDWLPREYGSYADLLLACWNEGRADLASRAGPDPAGWIWGRVGRPVQFPHPLAGLPGVGAPFRIDPLPKTTGGTADTVNAGMYVSMRLVADTADWDRTRQGIALGESGDPASPHWKDQLADWRAVTPRTFPFSRNAVLRAAVETLVLTPAGGQPAADPAPPDRP